MDFLQPVPKMSVNFYTLCVNIRYFGTYIKTLVSGGVTREEEIFTLIISYFHFFLLLSLFPGWGIKKKGEREFRIEKNKVNYSPRNLEKDVRRDFRIYVKHCKI